ncbi:MAG: kelch motif-containing protein, partial [Thermoplasmata archaeon]|nr:kelch motif-containing protein [Thermoplasmata archaeon]
MGGGSNRPGPTIGSLDSLPGLLPSIRLLRGREPGAATRKVPSLKSQIVVGAVAVVAILLLSGVPSATALIVGPAHAPITALLPAPPPVVAPPAPTVRSAPVSAPTRIPNLAAICLLGAAPGCGGYPFAPATPTPLGGPLSSWTNITPPTGISPSERIFPATVYYPSGHDVILFGGYGVIPGTLQNGFFQDTWSFHGDTWTPLIRNTSCTATSCPSPRSGAMLAYYPAMQALLLFGGYIYSNSSYQVYSDSWLFYSNAWHNVTSAAGQPPAPRYDGSMVYDPSDNYVLLFGGSDAYGGAFGDTWQFSNGYWTNITADEGGVYGYQSNLAPEPRAGAAIANSPSGYVMIYGGEDGSTLIQNYCNNGAYFTTGISSVAWWFYKGHWLAQTGWGDDASDGLCAPHLPSAPGAEVPHPAAPTPIMTPPCGRVNAALGWSPKNARFVLYGGIGTPIEGLNGLCNGSRPFGYPTWLNDTWVYTLPPGGGFVWRNESDPGDPYGRAEMGYASDFSDNYFYIFGGVGGGNFLNETWRFYAIVHASLSGPSSIDTAAQLVLFKIPFTVIGYGGSGDLTYQFFLKGERNSNALTGGGCAVLTNGHTPTLPYFGVVNVNCTPSPKAFNIYRLTVKVVDALNNSDYATANWTFSILPPESIRVYSEYVTYFYANVNFQNAFTVYAEVANGPPLSMVATLGGSPLTFHQRSGQPEYWDTTVGMQSVANGATILATAQFGNWTENTSYSIVMVNTPSWLLSLFQYTGATQSIHTSGPGPYNKTFTIDETYQWNIGDALGFSLPVPLVGGSYSLIPAITVVFSGSSTGFFNLSGKLSVNPPTIDLGVFSLSLSASLSLQGSFYVEAGTQGIVWESASADVSVQGTFSGSVPIYGFEILGVTIGFVLDLSVSPSVTLGMMLAPTTQTSQEVIAGIGVMIEKFYGSFTLPLSVAISFGIGIASVGIGGTLSVALEFYTSPSLSIAAGWVNGSVFVQAQFLFWSDSWTLFGGTIYSWDPPPASPLSALPAACSQCYNDGRNTSWVLHSRYYNVPGYDSNVWHSGGSSGPAISNIYPGAELSAAAAANGAYLFYTDDNSSLPVAQGMGVSGLHLQAGTNQLTALALPADPGFVPTNPRATTLSDGSLYVVWAALPSNDSSLASPVGITNLPLHGARYHPNNGSWGPVQDWSRGGGSPGVTQSYALDSSGSLLVLVAHQFLLGNSAPEWLDQYNVSSGALISSARVTGMSQVLSVRGSTGQAVVEDLGGNYSLVNVAGGTPVPIASGLPSNASLISASFVTGSSSSLVLLYREPNGSKLVLYDTGGHQSIGARARGGDTTGAPGGIRG